MRHLREDRASLSSLSDPRLACLVAAVLFGCVAVAGGADTVDLIVSVESYSDGELLLRVSVESDTPVSLYSWRGHLYPAARAGFVTFKAVTEKGRPLAVRPLEKFMPHFPHPKDVVTAEEYTYDELLQLSVTDDSSPYEGCFDLHVAYDTTGTSAPFLSKLRMETTVKQICGNSA